MTKLLRKFAPVSLAAVTLAAAGMASIAPASAVAWNSHDCKHYGVCAPWDLQYPHDANAPGGPKIAPYLLGNQTATHRQAAPTEESQGPMGY